MCAHFRLVSSRLAGTTANTTAAIIDTLYLKDTEELALRKIWPWLPSQLRRVNYGRLAEHLASRLDVLAAKTKLSPGQLAAMLTTVKTHTISGPEATTIALEQALSLPGHQNHSVHNTTRLSESLLEVWLTLKIAFPGSQPLIYQPTVSWSQGKLLQEAIGDALSALKLDI